MNIVCLDLEGVLIPEIWIAFAEKTGIEALGTTRDEPDYNVLMRYRLDILDRGASAPISRKSSARLIRCQVPRNCEWVTCRRACDTSSFCQFVPLWLARAPTFATIITISGASPTTPPLKDTSAGRKPSRRSLDTFAAAILTTPEYRCYNRAYATERSLRTPATGPHHAELANRAA